MRVIRKLSTRWPSCPSVTSTHCTSRPSAMPRLHCWKLPKAAFYRSAAPGAPIAGPTLCCYIANALPWPQTSLPSACPIRHAGPEPQDQAATTPRCPAAQQQATQNEQRHARSEEHTSELQSRPHLVCRLL